MGIISWFININQLSNLHRWGAPSCILKRIIVSPLISTNPLAQGTQEGPEQWQARGTSGVWRCDDQKDVFFFWRAMFFSCFFDFFSVYCFFFVFQCGFCGFGIPGFCELCFLVGFCWFWLLGFFASWHYAATSVQTKSITSIRNKGQQQCFVRKLCFVSAFVAFVCSAP